MATRFRIAPRTGTSWCSKNVRFRLNESTALPTPLGQMSSTGARLARATTALDMPTMEPTAGYPTPSTTTSFRPSRLQSSSTACRTSSSISAEVLVLPARNSRVNPEKYTTGPMGTQSIPRFAQNLATSCVASHCVAGLIYATSCGAKPSVPTSAASTAREHELLPTPLLSPEMKILAHCDGSCRDDAASKVEPSATRAHHSRAEWMRAGPAMFILSK
mmetsp:Transcript_20802/g.38706  ORF Transcript_20802/g.38706 Transcript_20802/m.38706 type:complete len:218 (+) Transcript_20802:1588-2241(+)